jgi:cyclase
MPYRPMPAYDTGVRELGDGLYAYLQWDGGWGISNAGFFDGDDGLLVIDALMVPSMTRRFVEAMRGVSNAPFRHLVNTHQHLDHTAGNQFIEGAEIVAHETCRQEMIDLVASRPPGERGPRLPWMPDDWWEELAQVVPTYPQTTFADHLTLRYGDTEARLMHFGPAHTLGDAMVYFPESRILFSGDLAFFYATPLCRGDLENWIDVVDLMLEMEVDTIIPGHGPIGTKLELSDQREYMGLIVSRTREMFDAGVNLEDAQAQIDVGEFAQWPESERNPMNVATLYAKWLSGGGSGV